jgi:hypothetical protein
MGAHFEATFTPSVLSSSCNRIHRNFGLVARLLYTGYETVQTAYIFLNSLLNTELNGISKSKLRSKIRKWRKRFKSFGRDLVTTRSM